MYQFFVNTADEQVGELLRFLTFLDHDEIEQLDDATRSHPRQRAAQKALARAVVGLVHGDGEVAKCEEASAALFNEEIAGLSEEMLLAVTADAPTTHVPRTELLDGGLTLVDALERTRPGHVQGGRAPHHRPGRRLRQQRAPDGRRRAPSARTICCTTATSSCARAAATSTSSRPHERRVNAPASRSLRLALTSAAAVTLTSCAGEDQMGSPAHRMSVWVNGTNLGEDIGTLVADNARIAKVVPNGTGAVHAACGTLVTDAEMANTELPSPDPEVTDLLTKAYGLEGTAGNQCYDAGATNKQLLAESARNAHQGRGALQRGAPAHPGHRRQGARDHDDGGQLGQLGRASSGDRHRRHRSDAPPTPAPSIRTTSSTATAAGSCGPCRPACT